MSPNDDKTDQAIGRLVRLSFKNPVVVGLIGICIGGPAGSYLEKVNQNPRIDSIMVMQRDILVAAGQIKPLQDTVKDLGIRVAKIEDADRRLAYMAPRKKSLGRRWER
jgi:hypothetical protein